MGDKRGPVILSTNRIRGNTASQATNRDAHRHPNEIPKNEKISPGESLAEQRAIMTEIKQESCIYLVNKHLPYSTLMKRAMEGVYHQEEDLKEEAIAFRETIRKSGFDDWGLYEGLQGDVTKKERSEEGLATKIFVNAITITHPGFFNGDEHAHARRYIGRL